MLSHYLPVLTFIDCVLCDIASHNLKKTYKSQRTVLFRVVIIVKQYEFNYFAVIVLSLPANARFSFIVDVSLFSNSFCRCSSVLVSVEFCFCSVLSICVNMRLRESLQCLQSVSSASICLDKTSLN